jgi:parvulin-like peptidyl-prolyl isomerase
MARKVANPKVTKKHLARAERERIQRNWILGGTIATALVVVGLLLFGVVSIYLTPVVRVNGEKISTQQFRGRIRLAQAELINQAIFQQQTEQLPQMLADVEGFAQRVLNELINEALIRQEVEKRGGSVTEGDIDKAMAEAFGYFPNGTPTSFPTFTPNPTTTALASITPTVTEGPTPTPTQTVTPGPSPTVTPTFTPRPTSTEYAPEAYQENLAAALDNLKQQRVSEEIFRSQFAAQIHRMKLLELLEDDVPKEQEHTQARHILVDDLETAEDVLELLAGDMSWEELASEYSTDESNQDRGGDLGWFTTGQMIPEFEVAVFAGQPGDIVGPFETSFGWHLVEILGREIRPMDDYTYGFAVQNEFNAWLIQIHIDSVIEISKDWLDRVPDPPNIGAGAPVPTPSP